MSFSSGYVPDYRAEVVETHGTFHDVEGRPTILDEMTRPRIRTTVAEPAEA